MKITAYRNLSTGEHVPPHLIGTTEDGRNLYQGAEGFEPVEPYETDKDGNWTLARCIAPMSDDVDPRLCGAPATVERDAEGLTCALCAKHAAEMDAERGEKEPPSIK